MASGALLLHWLQDSVSTNDELWGNISWSSDGYLNNSKYDDFSAVPPYMITNTLESLHPFSDKALDLLTQYSELLPFTTSAARLGLTTGLVLAVILNVKLSTIKVQRFKVLHQMKEMVLRWIFAATCLLLTIIAAPIVGVFMSVLLCYRLGVHIFLKFTQSNYVGLFEGVDAIWAVEEETARPIINVLAFIEVEDVAQGKNLLNILRKTITDHLATSPVPCKKLFYLRRQCLGYFYWEEQTDLSLEDYIRPLPTVTQELNALMNNISDISTEISEETLKNLVGEISNTTLPREHAACWEVLVGSQPVKKPKATFSNSSTELHGRKLQYPVMFRIHHSLGDGISLMKLLISVTTDALDSEVSTDVPKSPPQLPPMPLFPRKFPNLYSISETSETPESKIKQHCNIHGGKRVIQPPQKLTTQLKTLQKNNVIGNLEHGKSSKDSLSYCQLKNVQRVNEISIDLKSIEENDTELLKQNYLDEIQAVNSSVTSLSTRPNSLQSVKCRPLLLMESQKIPRHCNNQVQSNIPIKSKHIIHPSPNLTWNDQHLYRNPKVTASCNQLLTDTSPGNFSLSLSSNFQTSLPAVNLYLSDEAKSNSKHYSCIYNKSFQRDKYESESDLINSSENARCKSPTPARMSLEEPPTIFNKLRSSSSQPLPKSHYKLPTINKIPHSKSMTLHCYNHTTSDSYITIPEDLLDSGEAIEKCNSTSTTIYYYSPGTSPEKPNDLIAEEKQMIEPIRQSSKDKKTDYYYEENKFIKNESSIKDTNTDETDSIKSESHAVSLNTTQHEHMMFQPDDNSKFQSLRNEKPVHKNVINLGCNRKWNKHMVQTKKTKSEGELTIEFHKSLMEVYNKSATSLNANQEKHIFKNYCDIDNKISESTSPDLNSSYDYSCSHSTYKTQRNHRQENATSEQKLELSQNKFGNFMKGINNEKKTETVTTTDSEIHSSAPNQYLELLNTISNSNCNLNRGDQFSQIIQSICALALSPASLIHQVLMKVTDRNVLHGTPLSGYKVTAWYRDPQGDIFNCIKRIKKHSNARFTEVLLSALSASLETYFETHQVTCNERIPELVTVVIPARMEPVQISKATGTMKIERNQPQQHSLPSNLHENYELQRLSRNTTTQTNSCDTISSCVPNNKNIIIKEEDSINSSEFSLNNRFSVAMLQLPISQSAVNNKRNENTKFLPERRLKEVQHHCELLRSSLDYKVNYWMLSVIATYLPDVLLSAVVKSSQSTLVVSNIMGPNQELSFSGNKLRDIMFWVPHRGSTGIGITFLSYMEHLQIGIMADRALIHCKEDAQMILDETVVELFKLDRASI